MPHATSTGTAADRRRAPVVDAARGVAVIAMVIYHFSWDLSHFRLISTDVAFDPAWRIFSKLIAASFLGLVGVGLEMGCRNGVRWRPFLTRLAEIAGAALAVTVGSSFAFPGSFIFFGILHCIAVSRLLGLAVLRWPAWALTALGLAVFLLPGFVRFEAFDSPALLWVGLSTEVPPTNDYEPILPWFAYVLFGMALAKLRLPWLEARRVAGQPSVLEKIGRWSLPIYLLHQPVLFGLFAGLNSLGLLPPP